MLVENLWKLVDVLKYFKINILLVFLIIIIKNILFLLLLLLLLLLVVIEFILKIPKVLLLNIL